ncbi:MAG: putative metalloprotease CJM1_0395 family protein [Actinomycetota bacterium]
MTVSAIASAAFVPLGAPPRPPDQQAGDGRSEDVTGARTTESDGARRVVLSRSAEADPHRERDEPRRGAEEGHTAGSLGDGRRGPNGAAAEATIGAEPTSEAPGRAGETGDDESGGGVEQLTEEEQRVVREMKARDAEVRAHEMAHVAAGGAHVTGGPSYSYQQGPDGKRYAVGGEVGIDTSPEEDPQATIAKMAQVRAAAMAPAEPSGADRAVAAAAAATAAQARAELMEQRSEDAEEARGERTEESGVGEPVGVEPAAGAEAGAAGDEVAEGEAAGAEAVASAGGSTDVEAGPFAGGDRADPGSHHHAEDDRAGSPSHHHAGGGACPECVGARYGAAGAVAPAASVVAAA